MTRKAFAERWIGLYVPMRLWRSVLIVVGGALKMELTEAIKNRRSIRKYEDRQIHTETLNEIIKAGTLAPTASNRQAWKFIIITKNETKQRIVNGGGASFIKQAPASILVMYSNLTDNYEFLDHILSGSLAIQNMVLRAHELGIGSCIVCHLPNKTQMREILDIPRVKLKIFR